MKFSNLLNVVFSPRPFFEYPKSSCKAVPSYNLSDKIIPSLAITSESLMIPSRFKLNLPEYKLTLAPRDFTLAGIKSLVELF